MTSYTILAVVLGFGYLLWGFIHAIMIARLVGQGEGVAIAKDPNHPSLPLSVIVTTSLCYLFFYPLLHIVAEFLPEHHSKDT